jgi:hypothetical protein
MVLVCNKTFKVYTRLPGKSKTTTKATKGNLRDEKEAKSVQSSRDFGGFWFQTEKGHQGNDHRSKPLNF